MSICSYCNKEFDDVIELFPKLVVSRDERVARELSEAKDRILLCLACWFKDVKKIPKEDLAMAMLGLLKKVQALEENPPFVLNQPDGPMPNITPQTAPNTGGPWSAPMKPWGTGTGPVWITGTEAIMKFTPKVTYGGTSSTDASNMVHVNYGESNYTIGLHNRG